MREIFLIFFPFAKLRLLTSSEAFEAKGVMTKETKNAGIAEALLKAATASTCGVCVLTVGSATKATRAVGGGRERTRCSYQMPLGTALVAFATDPMVRTHTMGSATKATSAVPSSIWYAAFILI